MISIFHEKANISESNACHFWVMPEEWSTFCSKYGKGSGNFVLSFDDEQKNMYKNDVSFDFPFTEEVKLNLDKTKTQ